MLRLLAVLLLLSAPVLGQNLIVLHGPDGQMIWVNATEIVSLREPRTVNKPMVVRGSTCILLMTNGNLIAVQDRCEDVRTMIKGEQ